MKTPRLALFLTRLHGAAVALTRDTSAALESLRLVNSELLVTGFSDVPVDIAELCDQARDKIVAAIRQLDPLPTGAAAKIEELPPAEYRRMMAANAPKFDAVTKPAGLS